MTTSEPTSPSRRVELLAVLAVHGDACRRRRPRRLRARPAAARRPPGRPRPTRRRARRARRAACRSARRRRPPSRPRASARAAARPIMPVPPISTARGTRPPPRPLRHPMPRGEGRDDAGGEDDPGRDLEREVDAVPGRALGGDEHLGDELRVPLHAGTVLGAGDVAAGRHELDHDVAVDERDVELDELLVEPARQLRVDDRAEHGDAEDAAELAARVHGRRGHPRLLRRDDGEHRGGHRDERDPEADARDRERPRERRDARRRRELPIDEQEPEPRRARSRPPSAPSARPARSSGRRARPATIIATASEVKTSAIWLPVKFEISCR